MPLFIESPSKIYQGAEAAEKLQTTNDSRFVSDDGIIRVDDTRWQVAQEYERVTWLVHGINITDDRADQHRDGFNQYHDLPQDLGHVLELGCGVFTITNTILAGGRTAQSITLVDPLADAYKNHPHCTYRDGNIQGTPVTIEGVAIEQLDLTPTQLFDTVIMVNVLSHCRDARLVLDIAARAVAPGGVIVFQETVHDFDPFDVWDAGHPLRFKQPFLDAFMSRFEAVYKGDENYFVGRKPSLQQYAPAGYSKFTGKVVECIGDPPLHTEEISPGVEITHVVSEEKDNIPAPAKQEKKPARKSKGSK